MYSNLIIIYDIDDIDDTEDTDDTTATKSESITRRFCEFNNKIS